MWVHNRLRRRLAHYATTRQDQTSDFEGQNPDRCADDPRSSDLPKVYVIHDAKKQKTEETIIPFSSLKVFYAKGEQMTKEEPDEDLPIDDDEWIEDE